MILGTDGPAGSGVQPLGILRMVAMLSSLGDIAPEIAFCFATGNTARMRSARLRPHRSRARGRFRVHGPRPAFGRHGLLESVRLGDLPGVGMTMIDGIVRTGRSRNTPPAEKIPEVVGH